MNILFVGDTRGSSTSAFYYTSLLKLGHNVLPWQPDFFSSGSLLGKIQQRMHRGPVPRRVQAENEKLILLCRRNVFDLVFVMGETYVSREAIETIRKQSATRFLFHSHDNLYFHELFKPVDFFQTLATYDVVFTTKSQNEARYRRDGQANAHYIPSAYEPMVHRPIPRAQSRLAQDFDVSFVGTYDSSRDRWVEMAGWERLHVWGNDWRRYPGYEANKAHIQPNAIYYFEFADVCSRSRCSLGLLREEAEDLHTQRTFEICATGSLQIAPRNAEIRGFYEEGKEIVLFAYPEELQDKLNYYLAHETERARIARAGYERTLRDKHTYLDRCQTMLHKLAGLQPTRRVSASKTTQVSSTL